MSTINTTGIDETKPTEGQATTQSVRDNTSAVKTQLGNAKTDIESAESRLTTNEADIDALETGVADLSGVTDAATARTNLSVYSTTETAALVDDLSGVTDAATARSNLDVYSQAETAALHGRRNAIINGDFKIWQRGTSFTPTLAVIEYTADRWAAYFEGASGTVAPTAFPAASGHGAALRITGVASNTISNILTRLEGADCFPYSVNNGVLSFRVLSTDGGTYNYVLRSADVKDDFSAITTRQSGTFVVPAATWTTIEIPVTANTNYANGIQIVLQFGALLASKQINLTAVQLETGSVATPFEQRSYGEELALCQRYFQRVRANGRGYGWFYAGAGNADMIGAIINLPTTMRLQIPTITISSAPTYTNCTHADVLVDNSPNGCIGALHRVDAIATGKIRASNGTYDFDAEL
jgi:hypothetical protein